MCAVVPTYDNPSTIAATVRALRQHLATVVVVDDASHGPGRAACDALDGAVVVRHARNQGKGGAVQTGLRAARRLGFTHALQVDADGQHDLADVPRFLAASAARPDALVLGAPLFDASVPRARLHGRKVTVVCARLETWGLNVIDDPMCGFRVYPLAPAARVLTPGRRMDYDIEIAVRLAWKGVPVVNLPTRVRYLSRAEGGVSSFRLVQDNVRISWLHTRLLAGAAARLLFPDGGVWRVPRRVEPASAPWLGTAEKGSLLGMRATLLLVGLLGRRLTRLVLPVIALYFVLLHGDARRASRRWLRRVGAPHGRAAVWRHVLRFAQVTLDRVLFLRGDTAGFAVEHVGQEHLRALRASGRGGLLVGAHLGSFEAMRALAERHGFPVRILAYEKNARKINALLRGLRPDLDVKVIEVEPGAPWPALQAAEAIERGELVALLADRTGLGDRTATVPFLGRPATFPAGPWALAAALRCPVLLTFGLHRPPDRYELVAEPLPGASEPLPRGAAREAALAERVALFARRLEHHARRVPDNWFNFFDIWVQRETGGE